MNKVIGESERLYLRELLPEDAEVFYHLNNDPLVIQYTGDVPFSTIEAARKFLEAYDHFDRYKMGRWAVIRKADEKMLGWCGLKYHEKEGFVDLGYRLFRAEWNKGYATEASQIALEIGFKNLGINTIIARAVPANKASIRIMKKLGMVYVGIDVDHGEEIVIYKIERQDYLSKKLSSQHKK